MPEVRGKDPKALFRKSVMQVIFVAYGTIVIYPMFWLMYTSFKSSRELFADPWALPVKLHWENFVNAWRDAQIGSFFFNSVFVTMTTVAVQLVIGAMASYALARYRFRGNTLLYYFFLAGLMFPIFLALVPMFFLLRDLGLLAGLSSHNPDVIKHAEDSGWDLDLYMTCFYRVTRTAEEMRKELGEVPLGELYLPSDPPRMCEVVRQVGRPCLGFKILAAGRLCDRPQSVERAFRFAFSNVKRTDGVIVGMFPRFEDQPALDAALARRFAGLSR